ncbi:MAG: guanylate kinase [Clostridia bacterium]|nr:guanylate kinase [Clostridia bacterium]
MNKRGLLIVVSGPSGAGKGTLCRAYVKKHPDTFLSVSATTRQPREGETDGKDYYFLSVEDFKSRLDNDGFFEYAVFCDNYYGTPKEYVLKKLEEGTDVILEIEVQGAMSVRAHYPEGVFVFTVPPSMDVLRERLINRRTETEDVIDKRLERAKSEIMMAAKYNYILINDMIDSTVEELEAIIVAEKLRAARNMDALEKMK